MNLAADELRLLVERIERLEKEKKGIADDIKDAFAEAKSRGFCPKALKTIVAIRKKDAETVKEERSMVEVYAEALGMQYVLI